MLFLLLVDEEDYFKSDGIIGSYTKNIFDIEITLYMQMFDESRIVVVKVMTTLTWR